MPSLINTNNVSRSYSRVTTICIDSDFNSGTTSFTGTNATAGISGSRLEVTDSGSGGGYASRSFNTQPQTVYNYSIAYVEGTAGHLKLGTSADDGTHVNMAVSSSDPGYGTITGSFTATTKTTHITLRITRSSGTFKWDNLTISEDN
tara:strand:- start:7550 stop:7990 length:441 start_codon:yes stop_codon:yes gene_type:complete